MITVSYFAANKTLHVTDNNNLKIICVVLAFKLFNFISCKFHKFLRGKLAVRDDFVFKNEANAIKV